ncbi:MAG: 3'-5' exonuclease, partial [Solimonas sp.]
LADGVPPQHARLRALRAASRAARLGEDGRRRLARAMAVLDAALAQQGRKPLRRWIESAWLALGGPAAVREPRDLADAQQFFARLETLARGATLADLDALDLALANLKATPDPRADGRLALMTIHKAKGLEFDTVIVPGLGRMTRSDTPPPIVFDRRLGDDGREQLVLAPVQPRGDDAEPTYTYIRRLVADQQLHEDGRLLYVAATRARRRLHLLGTVARDGGGEPKAPPPSSLLARLWPAVAADYAAAAREAPPPMPAGTTAFDELVDRPVPPLRRLVAGWQAPSFEAGMALPAAPSPVPSFAPSFEWAGEVARLTGTVFHRWAERLAAGDLAPWSDAMLASLAQSLPQELAEAGVPASRCDEAARLVRRALTQLLADPRGRWLFDAAHREARSEWALTAWLDGRPQRFVIDRSFVDADGVRWIVDFKTGRHEGGDVETFVAEERRRYQRQLQTYAILLRRYGPQPVRAALYLPLLDAPALRWQVLDV